MIELRVQAQKYLSTNGNPEDTLRTPLTEAGCTGADLHVEEQPVSKTPVRGRAGDREPWAVTGGPGGGEL